jgi:hypothetical protein
VLSSTASSQRFSCPMLVEAPLTDRRSLPRIWTFGGSLGWVSSARLLPLCSDPSWFLPGVPRSIDTNGKPARRTSSAYGRETPTPHRSRLCPAASPLSSTRRGSALDHIFIRLPFHHSFLLFSSGSIMSFILITSLSCIITPIYASFTPSHSMCGFAPVRLCAGS